MRCYYTFHYVLFIAIDYDEIRNQNTPILNTNCHAKDVALMPLQNGNVFGDTYALNFTNPCAQAYLDSFAAQLAEWGVDFLKLDAV